MRYDLNNPLSVTDARLKLECLIKRKAVVELTEKKQRTLSQNAYLHVLLSYLALRTGNTLDYVKRNYYKVRCNPELFVIEKDDEVLHRKVKTLRSSTDLTKEEMSLSIDRLRNWSQLEAEIYLPTAEEGQYLRELEMQIEQAKQWL